MSGPLTMLTGDTQFSLKYLTYQIMRSGITLSHTAQTSKIRWSYSVHDKGSWDGKVIGCVELLIEPKWQWLSIGSVLVDLSLWVVHLLVIFNFHLKVSLNNEKCHCLSHTAQTSKIRWSYSMDDKGGWEEEIVVYSWMMEWFTRVVRKIRLLQTSVDILEMNVLE